MGPVAAAAGVRGDRADGRLDRITKECVMINLAVVSTVFILIFVTELPDKTTVASLVLGARYPASWVFSGVAAGFLAHVVIAVAAGSLLTLLPRRPVEALVSLLFLAGAVMLWQHGVSAGSRLGGGVDG
jgi:putative Ca2+/H+ antiporter (TMEM165/GDT1 family)